ncbi:phage head morphogenesis, SPP1 gp7 family domain protein [Glaesserella parasuis 84-15995]|nr:phage head morphogenesis, SPP1 gp7 family domain protein [Glaesserella parasuis 84-15995]
MHKEALKGVEEIYEKYGHAYASDSAGQDGLPKGGSLISQLRIFFNALLNKYNPIFNLIAKKSTEKMVEQTLKNTKSTLNLSLRELGQGLAIKKDYTSERVKDIAQAATMEAVSLIKTIPQKHLGDVQKVLMHSISSDGKGYAELKPFLQKLYKGNARKAHLVAIDQTRKTYLNIQAENMKSLGIKKFKWVHSGGGREPRKLHQELNGKVFSFDDPPYIGDMYGQKVYGLPGHLPNCGCSMSAVFDFEVEDD